MQRTRNVNTGLCTGSRQFEHHLALSRHLDHPSRFFELSELAVQGSPLLLVWPAVVLIAHVDHEARLVRPFDSTIQTDSLTVRGNRKGPVGFDLAEAARFGFARRLQLDRLTHEQFEILG